MYVESAAHWYNTDDSEVDNACHAGVPSVIVLYTFLNISGPRHLSITGWISLQKYRDKTHTVPMHFCIYKPCGRVCCN